MSVPAPGAASRRPLKVPARWIVLALILLLGLELRTQSVARSIVEVPIRGDAMDYVSYAYNLQAFGVYSATPPPLVASTAEPDLPMPDPAAVPIAPSPDARRMPGYPLLLAAMFDGWPDHRQLHRVLQVHAVLGAATVLLVYLLALQLLPVPAALLAAALMAISPHAVTMSIYVLSETLFTFLLALGLLLAARMREGSRARALAAGMVLAAAALTHPMAYYFVVPLAVWLALRPGFDRRRLGLLLLGFALLLGPWIARNFAALGAAGDGTLMRVALRGGIYADMMYQGDPETRGYPYRYDPGFDESVKSMDGVIAALRDSFAAAPATQLRWYLLGKPALTWSWAHAEGQGDVFLYPTPRSPYRSVPHFRATLDFMRAIHGALVALLAIGAVLAWRLPAGWSPGARFAAQLLSLFAAYHLAVMVAGFPLPRYTVPLRPILYIMALLPLTAAAQFLLYRIRPAHAADATPPADPDRR